jgi:hypothetical protein
MSSDSNGFGDSNGTGTITRGDLGGGGGTKGGGKADEVFIALFIESITSLVKSAV